MIRVGRGGVGRAGVRCGVGRGEVRGGARRGEVGRGVAMRVWVGLWCGEVKVNADVSSNLAWMTAPTAQ